MSKGVESVLHLLPEYFKHRMCFATSVENPALNTSEGKENDISVDLIYLIKSTEIPECTAPTLEAAWTYPQRGPWFLWTCSQAFLTIPNIHSQKKKQKNWLTNLYLKLFKSSDLEMKTCPTEKVTCLGM